MAIGISSDFLKWYRLEQSGTGKREEMTSCESLFVECWRSGIQLSVNGDKLHIEAPPPMLGDQSAHVPENYNLMKNGASNVNVVTAGNRLFLDQERKIHKDELVQEP